MLTLLLGDPVSAMIDRIRQLSVTIMFNARKGLRLAEYGGTIFPVQFY